MAIKKTLTGWDFCECPPCEERSNEIYPTTSDDQVIINELGSSLATWLNIGMDGTYYISLYSWLQANYPNSSYTLPVATDSTLGGVIIDTTNLTISNDGVLSVDVSSLNIPSVGTATSSISGTVKLGNSTTLTSNFSDGTISGQVHDAYSYSGHVYALPLRLDAQGRAGVVVPTDLFAVNQSKAASTWTFDWSKKVTNVSIDTPTSGVETNYILLGNKDVNTANGELGYDDEGDLSTSCGYPRLALVAGNGITMTRYTNTFIPQADNYWGGNITEILITADGDEYELPAATTASLGGIKLGYTTDGENKPVELDENDKAFVNVSNETLKNHVVTSKTPVVYDEYGSYFETYSIRCNISGEDLIACNNYDFTKTSGGYSHVQDVSGKTVTWTKTANDTGCYLGVLYGISTACKGLFKLRIHDTVNDILETHDVGFILDTPTRDTFAWFTTLQWTLSARSGNNESLVYLRVPDSFVGTITLIPTALVTRSGDNIGSFYNSDATAESTTRYKWSDNTWTDVDVDMCTVVRLSEITAPQIYNGHVIVPANPSIYVDLFLDTNSELNIGGKLYDNVVNDYVIHTLSRRLQSLQARVKAIEDRLDLLNCNFLPNEES